MDDGKIAGLRGGWDDLTARLRGEAPPRAPQEPEIPGVTSARASAPTALAAQRERADVGRWRVDRKRDFRESHLGFALCHRLRLVVMLATLLPAGRESVVWPDAAALLSVARFCAQRSELGVTEHWYDTRAFDDLLGIDTDPFGSPQHYGLRAI